MVHLDGPTEVLPSGDGRCDVNPVDDFDDAMHPFGIGFRGRFLNLGVDIPVERCNAIVHLHLDPLVGNVVIELQGKPNFGNNLLDTQR